MDSYAVAVAVTVTVSVSVVVVVIIVGGGGEREGNPMPLSMFQAHHGMFIFLFAMEHKTPYGRIRSWRRSSLRCETTKAPELP